ncbi:uncharacterized protein LOC117323354 isoform X2 [Pecten maximus]|uniref:uncharacterized protein LOC117323354 isoform X2 n=1 Tax=Pecten maximus TaxID=6579 RepID=UPI0014581680|nr:uncharacterized protein LOC117323354 isoform X2 [Pecten maximus]
MADPPLSLLENSLKQQLIPIFANLSEEIIDICVRDPSNLSNLQLCIDDLLELRTYTRHLAKVTTNSSDSWRPDPVVVDSDDDGDLVSALLTAESDEVHITQQFPATRRLDTDCLVTGVDTSSKKKNSVKIREATFKCTSDEKIQTSFSSPRKVSLLDDVDFDNDLPRFSPLSKTKSKPPSIHKPSPVNDILSSGAKTCSSILNTGHTAVVQQWCQSPKQALFTSPNKCDARPASLIDDDSFNSTKNKSDDTVANNDQRCKSAGILSPAKLKLPSPQMKQKSDVLNSHKYRFNPDSFQPSSIPVIRSPIFNPDRNGTISQTGTSNSSHGMLPINNVPPVTTTCTSPQAMPKKIKFKKSLVLPGDQLPATTITAGESDRLQASSSNTGTQDYSTPSPVFHFKNQKESATTVNKMEKTGDIAPPVCGNIAQCRTLQIPHTFSTSDRHQSNTTKTLFTEGSQINGLLAAKPNLDMPQSQNTKEIQTTTNVSPGACNWLQTQRSTDDNEVHSKISQKTKPGTINCLHPQTSNSLQIPTSGSQGGTSNKWPSPLSTNSLSQSSTYNKHQAVSQRPLISTANGPLATNSSVGPSAGSKSPRVASTGNQPNYSSMPQSSHNASLTRPQSVLNKQETVLNYATTTEAPTTAPLLVTAKPSTTKMPSATTKMPSALDTLSSTIPQTSNKYIVASSSGSRKTTSDKKSPSSTALTEGNISDKSKTAHLASLARARRASKAVTVPNNVPPPVTVPNNIPTSVPKLIDQTSLPGHQRATTDVTNQKTDPRPVQARTDIQTGSVTNPGNAEKLHPSTEIPAPKSRTDCLIDDVLALFAEADPAYVRRMVETEILTQRPNHEIVNNLCNLLLENHTYPRAKPSATATSTEIISTQVIDDVDYYENYKKNERRANVYYGQTEKLLMHQFIWISAQSVQCVLRWYDGHYAPTHRVLSQVMKQRKDDIKKDKGDVQYHLKMQSLHSGATINITVSLNGKEHPFTVKMLKNWRRTSPPALVGLDPYLQSEIDFIKRKQLDEFEEADHQLALMLNETEYEESGQLIECGCCYGEVPFENMIQCYEGHLFCEDCLQRYAKEAVFGAGKADLKCMTEGCDASYPVAQLNKALPSNILSKYEDRVQEENLNLADLADLVRCPQCDFAAVLDPGYPVFQCANPACRKETCRHCQEPWADHIGKTCEQVEKKDEVKLRVQFEEKMTMAKIRTCVKCKAKFTKSEGCNKMTCRCGSKMCYICRKPNIDYNHFCQHVREPGKGCDKCNACFLWSTGEEDDKRAIEEIRKEAEEARKAQGYGDNKLIGAPDEPPKKKVRV